MTVADLIDRLRALPQGAEVNVDDGELWPLKNVRPSDPPGIVILEYMVDE